VTDALKPGVLGAVVVNYNAGDLLLRCVASLRRAGIEEIVVVDNASEDGSLVALSRADPDVTLVPIGRNLGYGGAANRGVARLGTEFVLVCNPDLVVEPSAAARLAQVLSAAPDVAVVGPTIREPGGARYPSARTVPSITDALGHAIVGLFWPKNPWSARYRGDRVDRTVAGEAEWVSGACAAFRSVAFSSVGGFDEGYFMYVEDLDLCWRLRRAGWRIRYEPTAEVTHVQGVSARRHPYRMLLAHHRSTLRFARRSSTGPRSALLPAVAVLLGARLVLAVVRELTRTRSTTVSGVPQG
jgi:N-acetylglucosaminyl-diphospho-decaprenol L-rhamnosyltransferase